MKKRVCYIMLTIISIILALKFLIIPYIEQEKLKKLNKEQREHNKMIMQIFEENNYEFENNRFIIKSDDWWNLVEINLGKLKFYEICEEDNVDDCSAYYFEKNTGRYNYCRYDLKNDKPRDWCNENDIKIIKQTKQRFYDELDKLNLKEEDMVIY